MLFYIFALVIFEVGSTFADSSATVIDEVIPQMMAGRGHEESIFHGTWVVMFVLSKVKRWPEKTEHFSCLVRPQTLQQAQIGTTTRCWQVWARWRSMSVLWWRAGGAGGNMIHHDPYGRWCPGFHQRSPGRERYVRYVGLFRLYFTVGFMVCMHNCVCLCIFIHEYTYIYIYVCITN